MFAGGNNKIQGSSKVIGPIEISSNKPLENLNFQFN